MDSISTRTAAESRAAGGGEDGTILTRRWQKISITFDGHPTSRQMHINGVICSKYMPALLVLENLQPDYVLSHLSVGSVPVPETPCRRDRPHLRLSPIS